jgi:DNA-binding response OmpR family regulator
MLTAHDPDEQVRRSLVAGVNDLLGKPFRFNDLLNRIRNLVPGPV